MSARTMTLTPELVARCHRDIADAGPEPGLGYLDEDDYEAMLDETLAQKAGWRAGLALCLWVADLEAGIRA